MGPMSCWKLSSNWPVNKRDNDFMAIVTIGLAQQERVANGVDKASASLASDVVRIRYNLGEDWSGEGAVFFRVVLKDSSSKRARLREVSRRVSELIFQEVQPQAIGLQAYFNFRSESEQDQLKEEAWA